MTAQTSDNIEDTVKMAENVPLTPWRSISVACGGIALTVIFFESNCLVRLGWLQFYLYGVARAIQAQGLDDPNVSYLGCSAGALAAVGLVLDGNSRHAELLSDVDDLFS